MTNLEKYKNAFVEGLDVELESVESLVFGEATEWDSVGHMSLIACIEEAFDIMMETDDIIEFNSYNKGIELLEKYEVKL